MIVEKEENGKENKSMWCANSTRGMFPEMEGPLVGVYPSAYTQAISSRIGTVSELQINSPCKPDDTFISSSFVLTFPCHVRPTVSIILQSAISDLFP